VAEAEVVAGDSADGDGQSSTYTCKGGDNAGWKEVSHPSMGLGWHAQIDTILGMKGPRAQELYKGSHGLR